MVDPTGKSVSYLTSVDTDAALKKWWEDLHTNRSGERAELRRCSSPAEAAFSPAYIRLLRALQKAGLQSFDTDLRIASIAGLLAHLRPPANPTHTNTDETETESVATAEGEDVDSDEEETTETNRVGIRAFGKTLGKSTGSKALLSGLRFRRLLQTKERDERYRLMLRVIRIIEQQKYYLSPLSLAATMYWWERDNTRQQLAFGYYEVAPADTP
jgi:CRISPR type I-E-associated protein CasB/Cse2